MTQTGATKFTKSAKMQTKMDNKCQKLQKCVKQKNMLLSAHAERVGVSRMSEKNKQKKQ